MERARKRLRVCLICVVLAAIVVGIFYYYVNVRGEAKVNEGTLVSINQAEMGIWQ